MFKKYLSLIMVFAALAVLLGHNFIGHHHHNHHHCFDHHEAEHHHNNDSEAPSDHNSHGYSHCEHSVFIESRVLTNNRVKNTLHVGAVLFSCFNFKQQSGFGLTIAMPFIEAFYKSNPCFSFGLRGPPAITV